MSKEEKCLFKSEYRKDYQCPEPALKTSRAGYCILHERSNKDVDEFQKRIAQKIQQEDYDFTGYYFPVSPELHDKTFKKPLYFDGATFKENFYCHYSIFEREVYFRKTTFKNVHFKSIFKQGTYFSKSIFKGHCEFECIFEGYASFNEATFRGDVRFKRYLPRDPTISLSKIFGPCKKWGECRSFCPAVATLEGGLQCREEDTCKKYRNFAIVFKKGADFYKAGFRQHAHFSRVGFAYYHEKNAGGVAAARFEHSTFKDNAFFDSTYYRGGANFIQSTFQEIADFSSSTFKGRALFRGVDFGKTADLTEADFKTDYEGGALAFRLARVTQQNKGDYHKASDFHYEEMEYTRKQRLKEIKDENTRLKQTYKVSFPYKHFPKLRLSLFLWFRFLYKLFRDLSPLILVKWLCGYGEKPSQVIKSSLVIIFVFAVIYYFFSTITPFPIFEMDRPFRPGFFSSLYFSVVTFTTLGYGDLRPKPILQARIPCMIEAFTGAFMIALFVLVFAKKWMR